MVAIVVLAVVLSENVVYFRTVTEAVHNRHDEGTSRFRLAGGVVDHSIVETKQGVNFEVTDGKISFWRDYFDNGMFMKAFKGE